MSVRAQIAHGVALVRAQAAGWCQARQDLARLEVARAAGEVSPGQLKHDVLGLDACREESRALEATIRASADLLRRLRQTLVERGQWPDDLSGFASCGCLRLLQPCQACGLEDVDAPGCEHAPALCASCGRLR